jgi:hypothetical protein
MKEFIDYLLLAAFTITMGVSAIIACTGLILMIP